VNRQLVEVFQTLRRFEAPTNYTGHVWLFLRTPPQAGKTSP
jgi:hypothetical protein